ncbi:MAG: single-stranded-DNA-specific exonuclease RecJ [candidate division WOR-3 bacterium]
MSELTPSLHWHLPEPPAADTALLARELNLPELAIRLMLRRGLASADAIRGFLTPSPALLHQPATLPDIKVATERIIAALERRERICVYGDYDADGVTGTCLLVSALRRLGADVVYYLPHRESEGYGLSLAGVEFCRETGAKLLITNDCGSTDREAVTAAAAASIDVIITDHHEVPVEPPRALALVNPKRPGSAYPFTELAGVGVAFKLVWSLLSALGRPRQELTCLLDLVGIGTIADMVPLVGENRILARLGLAAIRSTDRPGLRALMRRAGIPDRPLTSYDVGFIIGPRLNAAGRISHASTALELLLADDQTQADRLAAELDAHNRDRQTRGEETTKQAMARVEAEGLDKRRVVVVAQEDWHRGVIGIVATRLVERYYRPCIVISLEGETGKGSGRSVNGFNLYESLKAAAEYLSSFGGHKYAAGLVIDRNRIPQFTDAINRYADSLPEELYKPSIDVDAVCQLDEINDDLVRFLDQLEPYGPENRRPVFATLGLEVVGFPRRFGRNQEHLKLALRSGETVRDAVAWRRSELLTDIEVGCKDYLDICFTVDRNTHQGRAATRLILTDLRTRTPR